MVKAGMVSKKHRTTRTFGENCELPADNLNPVAMLIQLHREAGGLAAAVAISYLEETREDRKQWRTGNLST